MAKLFSVLLVAIALASQASAQLTSAQLATLKTAIQADDAFNEFEANPTSDGAFAVADALNATASPAFIVWRTSVTDREIMQNSFDWTRVDNLSVGKARIWDWMFRFGSINPSNPNIRTGINTVWVGTQADLDVRAAVYVHCKRAASRVEKLFATGTGSDAVPATMAFEGPLRFQDVLNAMSQ